VNFGFFEKHAQSIQVRKKKKKKDRALPLFDMHYGLRDVLCVLIGVLLALAYWNRA